MIGQMDIKRQLRYKESIYDVLKDITLGNYNYLIIGKELDGKFIDIDFVEQKLDNGKISKKKTAFLAVIYITLLICYLSV